MEEAAKETFGLIMKIAILFGTGAIFYIWVESKLIKKWKKLNKITKRGRL
ncbi:hypothetical protein [Halomonas sp. MS1]|nr:hypothetical protein [Halomonas sp. MS1]UTD57612.1 hypothetical protein NF683_10550 [Halomonas sp. MS1]